MASYFPLLGILPFRKMLATPASKSSSRSDSGKVSHQRANDMEDVEFNISDLNNEAHKRRATFKRRLAERRSEQVDEEAPCCTAPKARVLSDDDEYTLADYDPNAMRSLCACAMIGYSIYGSFIYRNANNLTMHLHKV